LRKIACSADIEQAGEEKAPMKVVGVFYKAHEFAKDPKFLGCMENALGLREWLVSKGHTFIATDDKEGESCELEKHIPDMDVLITTPFHPAYMTAERLNKAKKLKLIVTAGVGSDHVDLNTAAAKGLTVSEVSGSNVVSVAEDELMRILILLRNFVPAWKQVSEGGWNVAAVAYKAFDLEGKTVGTVGSGRIGQELLKRLKPFDCKLLYYARHAMAKEKEDQSGAKWESDLDKFLQECDVVSINVPLSDKTRGMFNKETIHKMKKGAFLVNNARGAIVDVDAVKEACESGQLGGYSGDVWFPQPPPKDHSWRYMPNQAMTPHISGTTIDAQLRYAAGVKEMLEQFFTGQPFDEDNYIVKEGELSSQYK
jgi:formate dehydrogenase